MNGNHNEVLIAAAGNKKKIAVLRFAGFGIVGILSVVALLIIIGQGGRRSSEGSVIEVMSEPPISEVGRSPDPGDQRLAESVALYESDLKAKLVAINGQPIWGREATELVEQLDMLIEQLASNLAIDKSSKFIDGVKLGVKIVDEHAGAVEGAFHRLSESFDAKHLVSFERELANVKVLAANDSRLQPWVDIQEKIPEYFSAAKQAERAKAENSPRDEIRSLERVVSLGFGTPDTVRRIKTLRLQVATEDYEQYISLAHDYLDNHNYMKALESVELALLIFPSKAQAQDLRAVVTNELVRAEAEQWVVLAQEQAANDQWQEALGSYKKAKDLFETNQFASAGYEQAATILDYKKRLQDFYDRPLRLSDDKVMSYAKGLLEDAAQFSPFSPSLRLLIDQIDHLLREGIVPRSLWVDSDGNARIRVKGVGFIEPTDGKAIHLKPGKYDFYAECIGHKTNIYVVDVPLNGVVSPVRIVCGESI